MDGHGHRIFANAVKVLIKGMYIVQNVVPALTGKRGKMKIKRYSIEMDCSGILDIPKLKENEKGKLVLYKDHLKTFEDCFKEIEQLKTSLIHALNLHDLRVAEVKSDDKTV